MILLQNEWESGFQVVCSGSCDYETCEFYCENFWRLRSLPTPYLYPRERESGWYEKAGLTPNNLLYHNISMISLLAANAKHADLRMLQQKYPTV